MRLSPPTDQQLDVPGKLGRGEHVDHLEVEHFDIFGRNLLRLANFSWIPGDHLLDGPGHLPAGPPGLLLLPAPH